MSAVPIIILNENNKLRIIRKRLRDRLNPFDIEENRFIEMYRLPPHLALNFIEEVASFDDATFCSDKKITPQIEMLSVLNFLASGSYQRRVGSDALACMSQTCVSRCIRKYTKLIAEKLGCVYVKFPQTTTEFEMVKNNFFQEYGFPNIIGLIDGTHIALSGLKKDVEAAYINRKGFHSINTQLICDNDMKIINCNPRYPGSTHDSFVWGSSEVFSYLEVRLEQGQRREWLLGDSGYPLQPFLLTNFRNPATGQEKRFNDAHCKIRSKVERCIGLLKNRFRCLLGERKLRYGPETAANIISSCVVLHNFLMIHRVPYREFDSMPNNLEEPRESSRDTNYFERGVQNRNWVINFINS